MTHKVEESPAQISDALLESCLRLDLSSPVHKVGNTALRVAVDGAMFLPRWVKPQDVGTTLPPDGKPSERETT
jgi:hypothetical protein